jgi:hypothetical protein
MKKVVLLIWMGSLSLSAFTQNRLAQLADDLSTQAGHDKLAKQGLVQHMYTYTKFPSKYYVEDALKYERVGILTVMVKHYLGEDRFDAASGIRESFIPSEQQLVGMASVINQQMIPAIKEEASNMNIQVLTPSEYLKTDEQINQYLTIKLGDGSAIDKMVAKFNPVTTLASPQGYRVFPMLSTEGSSAGMGGIAYADFYQLGNLIKDCGLDGMIVVVINTYGAVMNNMERKLLFYNVSFSNFVVNQTPYMADRKYPKILGGYVSLLPAGYSRLNYAGDPIYEFWKKGDGEIIDSSISMDARGGITSSATQKVSLKTTGDYSEDLSKVIANFSTYFIQQANQYIEQANKKNKLN